MRSDWYNTIIVPQNSARIKLIALFALFALPAAALAVLAWILSIYTPLFKSLGQILLTIIILLPLIVLSGHLSLKYVTNKYLLPLEMIASVLRNILSKTNKPVPGTLNCENYKEIYLLLTQLQSALSAEVQTFVNLSESQTAQAKLLENALWEVTDPVILLNLKSEVKYINSAAQNFTGVKITDALGKKINQFVRFYDKNNEEIPTSKYADTKNSPDSKIFYGSEVKIISSINKQSFADLTVYRAQEGESIDVSCIILLHDKTKEKQLEAMKLDFVSMAAHELRTPLTTIKGYISVFINENQNKLTPEQLMFVTRINTSTQQLGGLVENLLSVARVERGAMTLHTQIVDWSKNVKEQSETFEHRADEKRIEFIYHEPKQKVPSVKVDIVRINEVLNNIISNAINYTEPQGKIEVWIDVNEDLVCTHVKDTGKGIPKEALPELFNKFFRVSGGSAEQASKGNGLGLYLSKAIIGLHQGKIWAESEGLGKGSTFSFCLPAVSDNIDISLLTKKI